MLFAGGCGTPVAKPAAHDPAVLARSPLPARYLEPTAGGERIVLSGSGWLVDVDPVAHLVFAGVRRPREPDRFALLLACEPDHDRLVLWLLPEDRTPLEALADDRLRRELVEVVRRFAKGAAPAAGVIEMSIEAAITDRALGPPLPTPRRVFAVAANYPSHLKHDLAVRRTAVLRSVISAARPRLFLKHPPTPPPGRDPAPAPPFEGIVGPFDEITYPDRIALPVAEDETGPSWSPTYVDYEVEIGVVIGQPLDADAVAAMTDDQLRAALAGLVLVNDTKARNPQVYLKVKNDDRLPAQRNPYRFDDDLDNSSAIWNEETCRWWSYAASWGSYTSIGPFFVAATPDLASEPRAVLSARSYAPPRVRGAAIPAGREANTLYLRQCSLTSENPADADALYWTVPQIIRSIVEPGTALGFTDDPVRLSPGDIICLGTPGGTVITSKPYGLFDLMEDILFFWDPLTWHDVFFADDANLYLRPGDRLFLWAEGLGFQLLTVREAQVADES